jgi:hypothetical protein
MYKGCRIFQLFHGEVECHKAYLVEATGQEIQETIFKRLLHFTADGGNVLLLFQYQIPG